MTFNILITGGSGQLGTELQSLDWPAGVELRAPSSSELDIASWNSVRAAIDATRPKCVINLAAYTAVDKAEHEVGKAFLVNAQGAAFLSEEAARIGAPVIHVSTDYVFDGMSDRAYLEEDPTSPLSAYGASKLAGELAVRAANARHVILRTAWVLSAHGNNFIKTMLRLGESHSSLKVVDDQIGCPTAARDIATTIRQLATSILDESSTFWGTYHFVNSGQASWNELAHFIFDWQERRGISRPKIEAIPTSGYPTDARRPANSRLDTSLIEQKLGIIPRRWQDAVDEILIELVGSREQGSDRI